ncbi:MAG: hypothetical protein PUP92_31425 [Rhizonema sp. PD38]|nr:hypothetical protein [Rhizonema sp. PD38]
MVDLRKTRVREYSLAKSAGGSFTQRALTQILRKARALKNFSPLRLYLTIAVILTEPQPACGFRQSLPRCR